MTTTTTATATTATARAHPRRARRNSPTSLAAKQFGPRPTFSPSIRSFRGRDCSSGQEDDVFFLPVLVNLGTDSINCNVPGNRRVLLNLGGWRCLDDHLTPNEDPAADCAAVMADPTTAVTFTATLDGQTLPGYRVDTGNFPVVLPQATAWSELVGFDLSGATTEAYSGFQVVLDPLKCGQHRIDVHVVFGAGTPAEGTTDLTYFLSVGRH